MPGGLGMGMDGSGSGISGSGGGGSIWRDGPEFSGGGSGSADAWGSDQVSSGGGAAGAAAAGGGGYPQRVGLPPTAGGNAG